mmetsp:Transcript_7896/g.18434  ORF Transcript_7896/g.18434 Transcript_7896/m.18434 type:complete len:115 (-) Transcript_7896:113-457(-)
MQANGRDAREKSGTSSRMALDSMFRFDGRTEGSGEMAAGLLFRFDGTAARGSGEASRASLEKPLTFDWTNSNSTACDSMKRKLSLVMTPWFIGDWSGSGVESASSFLSFYEDGY